VPLPLPTAGPLVPTTSLAEVTVMDVDTGAAFA
jgi:hypothetical protein